MERKILRGNFTSIPNKVLESLMKAKLSGTEISIILTICRDTYGWQTKIKPIGYKGFEKQSGLPSSYVVELVSKLKKAKVIFKYKGDKYSPNSYSLNEDVESWLVEFRGESQLGLNSQDELTSQERVTTSSQSEVTETTQSEVTQEINKEKKERLSLKDKLRNENPEAWEKLYGKGEND